MPDGTKREADHLTVALTDQIEAGPYRVDLLIAPDEINTRLKAIGEWLVEWQMPHQVRLTRQHEQARLHLSFTSADHAHAFQLTFGGHEKADGVALPGEEG